MPVVLATSQSASLTWYLARGSGFAVYGLLTAAVCLGILLGLRWRTDAWPRIITEELHSYIMLVAGVFLTLHIVTILLDTYVHFSLFQVLIPFTAPYRPQWVSLGVLSMYLGVALVLSTYLKRFIGYRTWRTMHYAGFVTWLLALLHGILAGTDAGTPWARAVYLGSLLLVLGLLAVRLGGLPVPLGRPPQLRPRVMAGLGAAFLLVGPLAALGPPGSGRGAGAQGVASGAGGGQTGIAATLPNFSEPVAGTATSQDDGNGQGTIHLDLSGQGSPAATLGYDLLVSSAPGGVQVDRARYSLTEGSVSCAGPVTYQPPDVLQSSCSLGSGQSVQVVLQFQISRFGDNVVGTLQVGPSASGPTAPSYGQGQ